MPKDDRDYHPPCVHGGGIILIILVTAFSAIAIITMMIARIVGCKWREGGAGHHRGHLMIDRRGMDNSTHDIADTTNPLFIPTQKKKGFFFLLRVSATAATYHNILFGQCRGRATIYRHIIKKPSSSHSSVANSASSSAVARSAAVGRHGRMRACIISTEAEVDMSMKAAPLVPSCVGMTN